MRNIYKSTTNFITCFAREKVHTTTAERNNYLRALSIGIALTFFMAGCARPVKSATSAPFTNKSTVSIASVKHDSQRRNTPVQSNFTVAQRDYQPVSQAVRQAVIDAYSAKRNRQWDDLPALANAAREDHELGSYPMYWYLRHQLSKPFQVAPTAALNEFIQSHPNTYVAERLKAEWAIVAAKQGDYQTVLKLQPIRLDLSQAQCAVIQAQAIAGYKIDAHDALSKFKPNEVCWNMMQSLTMQGTLGFQQIQPLLREAVEYNNKVSARCYAALVFSASELAAYDLIINNPQAWIMQQSGTANGDKQEELRALAFSRLARQNRDTGIGILQATDLLTPQDKLWAYTQFGLVAALNQENRAHDWYLLGHDVPLSKYNAAWRVRAALYQPKIDWAWVKKSINLMHPDQQNKTAWVYWYARALEGLGDKVQAQRYYQQLLGKYDFYGQLAREALGQRISWPMQATTVSSAELNNIKRNTALQKAIALFKMDARPEAVAEWNFGIRGMSERELLAAAEWAKQEHFYDRSINTSALTKNSVNFEQRYLAPFKDLLSAQAYKVGVNPSWVYGLIRQESRFVQASRSHAGASGLMQLMPGTAQLVAKKLGLGNIAMSQINDFDTNTLLGTTYLKMTLDKLGGLEVLATAGYNAGPNRAIRWRNNFTHPVEGAIFAETIPITETRLYVKHVMSNAVWYDIKFNHGKLASLVQRLGVVGPTQ